MYGPRGRPDMMAYKVLDNIFFGHGLSEILADAAGRCDGATVFAYQVREPERYGVIGRRFDAEAQAALLGYPWPGNVRELRDAIEHAFAAEAGDTIRHDSLPTAVRAGAKSGSALPAGRLPTLGESEAHLVGLVLEECGGNKTEAARRLGIDRKRLYRKIRKYGLLGDAPVDDGSDD